MFPISESNLSFSAIADYWSREIRPSATSLELLQVLERVWWGGEIVGGTALSRLRLLQHLFKSTRELEVVFVVGDARPPDMVTLPDGTVEIDLRPVIWVPSENTEVWNDTNCADAYKALGENSPLVSDFVVGPALRGIELSRDEFMQWLERRRYNLPIFWGPVETRSVAPSPTGLAHPVAGDTAILPQSQPIGEQRKGGRPAGTGWKTADEPLLKEMASLLEKGTVRSANDAARIVSERAQGYGTRASKQKRLARRYLRTGRITDPVSLPITPNKSQDTD